MSKQIVYEPLFERSDRISAIPLVERYSNIWANYELEVGSFWSANKIVFGEDIKSFPHAPVDIQESTLKVLGYFAGSDEIVEDIIKESLLSKIQVPEIEYVLGFEATMENIHSIVYNKTIAAYVPDPAKRKFLFNAINTMPSVQKKADWARQWLGDKSMLDRVVVGKACIEGINFSSSFAWIDWLKTQKYRFDGLYEGNEEISRDENRHVETMCHLHELVAETVTPDNAKEIMDGCLEVEYQFVRDVISPKGYLGMNQNLMIEYVRHCAAVLAADLGYEGFYKGTSNPFAFMKMRSLECKTNFFEKRGGEYTGFGAVAKKDEDENLDDAFKPNAKWSS